MRSGGRFARRNAAAAVARFSTPAGSARSLLAADSSEHPKRVLESLGTHRNGTAKRIVERDGEKQHESDQNAQRSDHQLLHDGLLKAEEKREADRDERADNEDNP